MITRLNAEQAKKRQTMPRVDGAAGKGRGRESGAEASYYLESSPCSASCLGVSSVLRVAGYPSG